MALTKVFQRYTFSDAHLNAVLQDYRRKMNEVIDYFLDTDFGNLALYDTDKTDVLNLKWNEDDSNPRDLNFKVNKANRTISMSGNLTVEGASLINSDLTTDANWATSGSITATSFIIGANTLNTGEWAFLDGQDQALKTSDAPGFATGVTIGKLTLADGSITESDGAISFGNENLDTSGYIALKSNAELRFYDNGNYVGFEAPALGADCIWVLPTADGATGEHMVSDGSKTLSWTTGAGTGDVSAAAVIADHTIVRGNGGAKGVQDSGIVIDDSDRMGIGTSDIEAWHATFSALQLGGDGSFISTTTSDVNASFSMTLNAYYDGAWKYRGASSNEAANYYMLDGKHTWRVAGAGTADNAVSWTTAMTIDNAANIGMGTATPTRTYGADQFIEIEGATNPAIIIHDTGQASDYQLVAAGDFIGLYFGNTRLIDFNSAGNVNIPSATSTITGGTALNIEAGANGVRSDTILADTTVVAANMYIDHTTSRIMKSTAGNRKYKDNIEDLELDTFLLRNLRPVSFNSKCTNDDKKKRFAGLVVDEVEQIYPSAVEYNKENEPEAIDYRAIQMVMLKEIQNLRQELDELKK